MTINEFNELEGYGQMIKFEFSKSPQPESLKIAQQSLEALFARRELGFWQLPSRDENWRTAEAAAQSLSSRGSSLVVLGLGGSALGGKCLVDSLAVNSKSSLSKTSPKSTASKTRRADVRFLFNTDPVTVSRVLTDEAVIRESQFIVISKSGQTLEIACLLEILVTQLRMHGRSLQSAVTVVTEPTANSLSNWAKEEGLEWVIHPQDVGGRFSAFTPVGLIPAAFAGIDLNDIRAGTQLALSSSEILIQLAAFYLESFKRGESISAFWAYADALSSFLLWVVQLWAESLAKNKSRKSVVPPVVSTPVTYVGTCDQHSVLQQLMEGARDKSVCFIRNNELQSHGPKLQRSPLKDFAYIQNKNLGEIFYTQSLSTEAALREAGRTTLNLELACIDAKNLAELMMIFELLIGVLGEALDIDAFNQPGVEFGKKITKEKLQKSSRL